MTDCPICGCGDTLRPTKLTDTTVDVKGQQYPAPDEEAMWCSICDNTVITANQRRRNHMRQEAVRHRVMANGLNTSVDM